MAPTSGMTATSVSLLAVAVALAAVDWLAVAPGGRRFARLEYIAKPAVPLALMGVAASLHPADPTLRRSVLAMLLCCLVGDVLLMLPAATTVLFGGGLTAFLAAHVLLLVGLFGSQHGGGPAIVLTLVVLGLATAAPAWRVLHAVATDHRPLLWPVVVYMLTLLLMGATAVALGAGAGRSYRDVPLALGGVLFVLSDTMLATDRFVRPRPRATLWVHITYHAALALLVVSLAVGPSL